MGDLFKARFMSRMNSLRDIDLHKMRDRAASLTEEQIYKTIEFYYRKDGRSLTAFEIVHILDAPSKRVEDLMTSLRVKGRIIKVDQTGRHSPVGEQIASAVTVTRIEPQQVVEDVTRHKLPEDEELLAEVLILEKQNRAYARTIADKYGVKPKAVVNAVFRARQARGIQVNRRRSDEAEFKEEEGIEMQTETRETTPVKSNPLELDADLVEKGRSLQVEEHIKTMRSIRILRRLFRIIEDDIKIAEVWDVLREEGVA